MRIGFGTDTHRLVKGRKLIIGGVKIDHPFGLEGHSDADVLCHAVIDSLLGAAALGDIGQIFPDTEERYRDANSIELLKTTVQILKQNGWKVINIDATVTVQQPKLAKYRQMMRSNISDSLNIAIESVSIKFTTTEGLGYEGRQEGILANSVCLIERI